MINVYKVKYNGKQTFDEKHIFSIPDANIQDFEINSELEYDNRTYLITKKKFGINNFGLQEIKLIVVDITE